MIGRLAARGLDDELAGTAYAVIDGTDGGAHHIRLPDLDAAGDSGPGSIVELRRYEDSKGRQRLALAVRADLAIEAQSKATGATWLDRQLLAREKPSISDGGFGREVRGAMDARVEFLISEGLARRQGQRVIFIRDLLETLRRRELDTASAKISAETGLPYHSLAEGESIAGVFDQDDPVGGLGDLGEQRIDEGGLSGRRPTSDQDIASFFDSAAQHAGLIG